MSDYIQLVSSILVESRHGGHHPRSLNKSFAGFPDVLDPAQGVALLITNKYEGRNWPDDFKHSMSLEGAVKDSIHIRQFLEKFGPTMGVNAQAIDDASRKNIVRGPHRESYRELPTAADNSKDMVYITPPPLDVTSDGRETETLEGLTAKVHSTFLDSSSPLTLSAGNGQNVFKIDPWDQIVDYYRLLLFRQCVWWVLPMVLAETDLSGLSGLKFVLNLGQDGSASWHKTDECQWGEEIASPMLHIAGSLREEQVYETRNAGGYLTEVAEPMSLPQILLHLRERVDHHLSIAKEHPKYSGKLKGAKQVPQPLDDPEILSKIGLGKNVPISY
ncbi:hypothetical protein RHS04_01132 [Rhizoctonia solani]|uniref:Uncharacterized protein n=1 Tax=Rhizoctonia solani TaxID=456999 RepID=A0A8H7HF57_9AGAM|nr:hypothetical protein RHS04_01132 [Rhizoctonia solani]